MSSVVPLSSSHIRRHRDPPILWQAVLIGSLLLHLAALFTLRRFQVEIVAPQPMDAVPVEMLDLSATAGTDPTAQTTTLTAPNPITTTPQPAADNPTSAPAPDESAIALPRPATPAPSLPPTPVPTQPPSPAADAQPPAAVQPKSTPSPGKSTGNPPAAQPVPQPPAPSDGFERVPVPTKPVPGTPPGSGGGNQPSAPPSNVTPVGSGERLAKTTAAVSVGMNQQRPTSQSSGEAGGELTLKITSPPQLEIALFGALQPGKGQELTAQVKFAVDHTTSEAILESIQVLPQSPALQQNQITEDNLTSLVKKAVQSARFEVTNNSSATNKAQYTEWQATMMFKVL
jgi:hypothetical protein